MDFQEWRDRFVDETGFPPTEGEVWAAATAERERWKEKAIAACNRAGDGPDNGCCPTYWEEAREACIAAIQKA